MSLDLADDELTLVQQCNRWSLWIDKWFQPKFHNGCDYLSMPVWQCMKRPVAHLLNSTWFWIELPENCCEPLKFIMKYISIQFCERPGHGRPFHALVWEDILTPLYIDPGFNISYDILTPGSIYCNDILTPLTIFWPPLPIIYKTVLLVMHNY